jgi:6-phosphogluconate dehydrogenase (decarboxylating)
MRFGIVGLGRMDANMARAAIEHGHQVVGAATPSTSPTSSWCGHSVRPWSGTAGVL